MKIQNFCVFFRLQGGLRLVGIKLIQDIYFSTYWCLFYEGILTWHNFQV
jgi:hypothetical protein